MKYIILTAILIPTILLAQTSPPPSIVRRGQSGSQTPVTALPDNYQVTLLISDKDGQPTEVSVVIASTRFETALGEQGISFQGAVTIEESGSMVIEYSLAWTTPVTSNNNVDYRQSSTTGSARLKLGEEVQIIKADSRVARLSIKKLETPKGK